MINIITRLRLKYGEDVRFSMNRIQMEPSVLSRSRMTGKKTVNSRRIMAAVMVIVMLAALTGCVGKRIHRPEKE